MAIRIEHVDDTGNLPAPRYAHAAVYDDVPNKMIVFGGHGQGTNQYFMTISGVLEIIPGSFSTAEVVLSVGAGGCCALGGYRSAKIGPGETRRTGYPVRVGFSVLQVLAIALSMIEPLAYD
jgi:hypothetical protein